MRTLHQRFPHVPLIVVAKEISLEDVRLGLEKMPDRFFGHQATVLVVTNLNYSEAPRLMPKDLQAAAALNWQEVRLIGSSAHDYAEQIDGLGVGSLGLASPVEVFTVVTQTVKPNLKRCPDGEIGGRRMWTGWQWPLLRASQFL